MPNTPFGGFSVSRPPSNFVPKFCDFCNREFEKVKNSVFIGVLSVAELSQSCVANCHKNNRVCDNVV